MNIMIILSKQNENNFASPHADRIFFYCSGNLNITSEKQRTVNNYSKIGYDKDCTEREGKLETSSQTILYHM